MNRPKIVVIEWEDPTTETSWTDQDEAAELAPKSITSCGMLLNEDSKYIRLVLDWGRDGEVNTMGIIPKTLIIKRKELNLPRGIWSELKYSKQDKIKATVTKDTKVLKPVEDPVEGNDGKATSKRREEEKS